MLVRCYHKNHIHSTISPNPQFPKYYLSPSTMVADLGLGKFYGSSLPRPRFYKPNCERVEPPVPVTDPLLAWANEAHWSMGGLSLKRLRLQGRIEGNVQKLRAQRETPIPPLPKGITKKPTKRNPKLSKPAGKK